MTIRPGQKSDVPEILKLIHELAHFEKEPEAVKTTEEDLLRDGFSSTPFFHTLILEEEGEVQGMALYFFNWSTWEGRPSLYLEDLYVKDSARGKGFGRSLLIKLAQIAVEKNCARFEWEVLDWNQKARDFYHQLGAEYMEGWLPYRVEGEKLIALSERS